METRPARGVARRETGSQKSDEDLTWTFEDKGSENSAGERRGALPTPMPLFASSPPLIYFIAGLCGKAACNRAQSAHGLSATFISGRSLPSEGHGAREGGRMYSLGAALPTQALPVSAVLLYSAQLLPGALLSRASEILHQSNISDGGGRIV